VSDSGADTAGTGVAVVAAAAAAVSPMVVGEVAVVAGVGAVVVAAAVVGEPVVVVGKNLLRGRQRRGLFPGRLSKAAGFPEGPHPAESNIGVVLSTSRLEAHCIIHCTSLLGMIFCGSWWYKI
jgi:hypothetical protein